ncbi:unnamed protein product [Timema podura]|uniref:Uncharacterized protein n=1 Tax=Timema podura TaxID=61482 RepID=A0ABN7NLP3_TIMPD|nr:unnamed protein product [Timema podura]
MPQLAVFPVRLPSLSSETHSYTYTFQFSHFRPQHFACCPYYKVQHQEPLSKKSLTTFCRYEQKTILNAPDYYLNLNLPIIGGLVYCEIRTSTTPSGGFNPTALPIEHHCGQWLPHNKLELLGISLEVDQAKLIESRKPTDRKAVRKAYQEAMVHRCQVAGTPIVGAVTRHGKLTSMFKLPQTFSKDT